MSRIKTLHVREPYRTQILTGRKSIEVRVGYANILRLEPGDRLRLGDQLVTILRIGRYADFEELLAHEDPAAIAPDLPAGDLLAALRQIYPADKEMLGAIALELSPVGRYDAILFDMGYTLIYFDPPQEIIVQKALQAFGIDRSVEEINAAVEVVWGAYYRDAETATFPATERHDRESQLALSRGLLAQLGLDVDESALQAYTESIESSFSRPGVIRPYREVPEVLASLQEQGYRLGIVSNWSWNLRDRVAQAGLESWFEIAWASAYAGCNKPHPGIFQQALAQMEVAADSALYVGDSYQHDVVGARNAGMDVILLDRDGQVQSPDCPIIRDLCGLFDLLAGERQT